MDHAEVAARRVSSLEQARIAEYERLLARWIVQRG